MAGVGFDDQPDEEAGRKIEGADCAGRDVDEKARAGFYTEGDHCAASFRGFDRSGKNVAGAEEVRQFGGDEDIACANGDADFPTGGCVAQGDFDFAGGVIERDPHDAVGGTMFNHDCGEDIFKAGGMGEFDRARRIEDGARRACFLDAAVDECHDSLADGVDFFAIVGDVKDRNAIGVIPGAKVFEYGTAQGGIEAGERFIEKQNSGAGDEGAGEGNALLFAAGEFGGAPGQQILDTKFGCDVVRPLYLFRDGELAEAKANILFDGEMGEQSQRLKNIGKFAALRREREIAGGVEVKFIAEVDFAGVRLLQAGDAIEQRGFSGA